jgi:hypothetical protein
MRHANTDLFSKSSVMAPHPFQTHFIAEIAVILKSGGARGTYSRWPSLFISPTRRLQPLGRGD